MAEEKKIVAFCKSLEESKLIKKGSHKRPEVIAEITKVVALPEEEVVVSGYAVQMIHNEYSDWVETYKA